MKSMPIYFSDLNEAAQKELLEFVGVEDPKDMNWDVDILPLAYYDVEDTSDQTFSAIWEEDQDLWSTDIHDVIDSIDRELAKVTLNCEDVH